MPTSPRLTQHSTQCLFVQEMVMCALSSPAGKHWSSLQRLAPTVGQSLMDAQRREKDEADTVTAMASLTVDTEQATSTVSAETNRSTDEPMEEEPVL
ncbi:hypothetical protein UPYG_G00101160 [Umbra pygmaea]|uniref:Uncharacterized protein n=1 Tax=Umbra pygmaea TaxID=75934 RepID=A0ABD0XGI9_UMBPY